MTPAQEDIFKAISYFSMENIQKKVSALVTPEENNFLDMIATHFNIEPAILLKEEYRKVKLFIIQDCSKFQAQEALKKIVEENCFDSCSCSV